MFALWVAGLVATACAKQATGSVTLDVGLEEGVLTRAPAVTTLVAEQRLGDGGVVPLARATLPVDTLDLGDFATDEVGVVRVRGEDAQGATVVAGESLPVRFGAIGAAPLRVFLQRRGELARLPAPFAEAPASTLTALLADRYVLGVEGTRVALYDLANLAPVASPPTLPVAPRSIAVFGTRALLVSDAAKATVFDFSDASVTPLDAPAGGTFAEVAGGAVVHASDGTAYLVGGTRRRGDPTAKVLRIAASGELAFATLVTPRRGAGAAWIEGRGVVVGAGSATGAGLELLGATASAATALAFPPDATEGAALAGLGGARVAIASGTLRSADLGCAAACAVAPLDGPKGLVFVDASALALPSEAGASLALFAGVDAAGALRVVALSAERAREIPLRVPRPTGALVRLPTGNVALFGGAREVESFRP